MLLLVAHPLPPFGFGSRRNRQSVLLHDWIPWSILYPDLFAGSSWCTTHTHIFPPVLVQYQSHLVRGRSGRRPPWHSGNVRRTGSAKLCPKSPYVPRSHTYLDCYRWWTWAFLDLPHCVTYGLDSQTFCHRFPWSMQGKIILYGQLDFSWT